MNKHIRNAILNGRFIILLGAGASDKSKNRLKESPPFGWELSKLIAESSGFELEESDELSDSYSSGLNSLGQIGMQKLLEKHYKHCIPSHEYTELVKFPSPRIYTFNIDDAIENAALSIPGKVFNVRRRNSRIDDFDPFYTSMDLIKLNGDINFPEDGFIFSPSEYGEGSAEEPVWYVELARDFHRFTFLFIGTKIKEPLFRHQIEKYKKRTGDQSLKSYLLVPKLSPVQEESLNGSNIDYIEGTLSNFIQWLNEEFPKGLNPSDILKNTRPEMNAVENFTSKEINALENITVVNRLELLNPEELKKPTIKEFYKGFKPSWQDIINNIPALLESTRLLISKILDNASDKGIYLILGPAGSGKTTALKQIALTLSDKTTSNCYYINDTPNDLAHTFKNLEQKNDEKYFVFLKKWPKLHSPCRKLLGLAKQKMQ